VDRRFAFGDREKEAFRSILRRLEAFSGVEVATYCLLGNHFHLLLRVPDKETMPKLDAERLLELLPLLYDPATVETVAREIAAARKAGDEAREREVLARYERRRGDLSAFLRDLKQRVTLYINKRSERVGTLWEGRFKSVLVEGGEEALAAVAAYIDLNPVRAGIAALPEDYRWSCYGEACGTGKGAAKARAGLASIQREGLEAPGGESVLEWSEVSGRYRRLLYAEGVERRGDEVTGEGARRGIAPEEVERVVEGKAAMPLPEVLRRKVRYFTDGAVLGSAAFVEEAFGRLKASGRVGPKRSSGARRMRGADFGDLRVLRDLQVRVVGEPNP
jgi:putative transposase